MIKKKNIRNVKKYLCQFEDGQEIRIAMKKSQVIDSYIEKIGFSIPLTVGETLLPDAKLNRYCMINSEGKVIIQRHLPQEKAERYWEWSWKDFGGNEHWDFKYIPYMRYPREFQTPEAIELLIVADDNNCVWISTEPIKNIPQNYERIKLAVNLYLSLFGQCEIVNIKMEAIKTRTLSWEVLKPGEKLPKEKILEKLDKVINERVSDSKKNMFRANFTKLLESNPSVIAIGEKSFYGYVVFEYLNKNIAILESMMPNNATYILGKDWESISQYTKSDVLSKNLHIDRLYHYGDWLNKIKKYIV